jgi:hypothetical protein
MNEALTKEILARLDAAAARLGVGAEHLWAVTIRQVQLEAVAWLVTLPLVLLLMWKVVGLAKANHVTKSAQRNYFGDSEMGVILAWVGFGIVALINLIAIPNCTLVLMNPEYYAFKALVGG